jgi:hypothetical protein
VETISKHLGIADEVEEQDLRSKVEAHTSIVDKQNKGIWSDFLRELMH